MMWPTQLFIMIEQFLGAFHNYFNEWISNLFTFYLTKGLSMWDLNRDCIIFQSDWPGLQTSPIKDQHNMEKVHRVWADSWLPTCDISACHYTSITWEEGEFIYA